MTLDEAIDKFEAAHPGYRWTIYNCAYENGFYLGDQLSTLVVNTPWEHGNTLKWKVFVPRKELHQGFEIISKQITKVEEEVESVPQSTWFEWLKRAQK